MEFSNWIGKSETSIDIFTQNKYETYLATLDFTQNYPNCQGQSPLAIHWCLNTPRALQSEIGEDGHPKLGGFLPPIPFPRRMWAGGKLEFISPILVGDEIERQTKIEKIESKTGNSGALCFLTLSHQISTKRGIAINERQDLVYRPAATEKSAAIIKPTTPKTFDVSVPMKFDNALLFRFSALTFNAHRIHYDFEYATKSEFYDGLVVHGPLQASILLQFGANLMAGKAPKTFEFRGQSPLYCNEACTLKAAKTGDLLAIWFENAAGQITMSAQAQY